MSKVETVFADPQFTSPGVNKVNNFTGNDLTTDTYYFSKEQILPYHSHPNGDQVFFILKGQGKFFLDNGSENTIDVVEGSVVYVPAGVWHKLENTGDQLIASQVTKAGAGMESKQ